MIKRIHIDIPEIEKRYTINKNGDIFDKKLNRNCKPHMMSSGYVRVCVRFNGKQNLVMLHRLLACKFIGNPPENTPDINHIDGNKQNNEIWNLEWLSRKDNIRHAHDNGFHKKANIIRTKSRRNDAAILLSDNGFTHDEISSVLNITSPRVNQILKKYK
jgi:hypothetical protein